MTTVNLHTREQVTNLLNDAFDVYHVEPDALWIVIARVTDVLESEIKRAALVEAEHARLEEKNHPLNAGELLEFSQPDE